MAGKTYTLTGVTGGLGSKILHDMLHRLHVPASSITVTSRSEKNRAQFEEQGLTFKILDYGDLKTIENALVNADQFLFVSSPQFDNDKRRIEHQNVVQAAKTAGVKKTWYVSLAFGGFEVNRNVSVQQIHNETEEFLIESGLDFVSLRAGLYSDAFPLFLNWYPSAKAIYLPEIQPPVSEGYIGLTSRDELGEGMANIIAKGLEAYPSIKPRTDRQIVLLTSSESVTFVDVAETIKTVRGNKQTIEILEPQTWVETAAKDDEGGKSESWFKTRLVWFEQMCRGALKTTDPALSVLLGRKPRNGVEDITEILKAEPDYSWHQNHGIRA